MLYLGLNKRYLLQPPSSAYNKLSYTLFLIIGHYRDFEIGNSKEGQGQSSWKRWSLDEKIKTNIFTYSSRWPRVVGYNLLKPGEFFYILGHPVNSLNTSRGSLRGTDTSCAPNKGATSFIQFHNALLVFRHSIDQVRRETCYAIQLIRILFFVLTAASLSPVI